MWIRPLLISVLALNLSAAVLAQITASAPGPSTVQPNAGAAESQTPQGLADSEWSGIQTAHVAWLHRVCAAEVGHRARNPGQQWTATFDGRGFSIAPDGGAWNFGLELGVFGWAEDQRRVGQPASLSVAGERMAYHWDDQLTEWFINDQRGLEHGYTVHSRPTDAVGSLTLSLDIRGGLVPVVSSDRCDVVLADARGMTTVSYAGLKAFDADNKPLVAGWKVRDGGLLLTVDDRCARYPVTIDPIVQQAYLKASNTDPVDWFGSSVSVSGDTVVVGAARESSNATGVDGNQSDNSATSSGAAYVFVRSGTGWSQQAYLKASNSGNYDFFGSSVSVSGDTIVVGARSEDSGATGVNGSQGNLGPNFDSGAVYVFVRNGTTWTQQAYLKASNTDPLDWFGSSVSVSGDTVVVGAPAEDGNASGNPSSNSASGSGAAYVFVRSGSSWTQEAYLKASNAEGAGIGGDYFGASVSVSGDTVVVGAYRESSDATGVNGNQSSNNAYEAGAAYVFARSGTVWAQQAYLKASNTGSGDQFGGSVSVSGDTIVVGALAEDGGVSGVNGNQASNTVSAAGAAYVFVRSGTSWAQQAYLKASNPSVDNWFGSAVSVSGGTIVVAARLERSDATGVNGTQGNTNAFGAGAAYVFVRNSSTWSQQAYLKASNTAVNDWFGAAVSVSGDTVVVGAMLEDSSATGVNGDQSNNGAVDSGAVYIFSVPLGATTVVGTGCGTSVPPGLSSSVPVLGQIGTLSVSNATPLAAGMLYVGSLAPAPLVVAPGCEVYLDLASFQPFSAFAADGMGSWSLSVSLPQDPALAGLELAFQAAVTSNTSPIGLDLTNAVSVVLGY